MSIDISFLRKIITSLKEVAESNAALIPEKIEYYQGQADAYQKILENLPRGE